MDNLATIEKAFKYFRNRINKEVIDQLNLICQNILVQAIRARLSSREGHDYTGNLINSIVVVLYDEGEISEILTAGKDGLIKKPMFSKMYERKRPFVFRRDYSGRTYSRYIADVPTDKGFAESDIEKFIVSHQPSFTKGYCITVAYTVEYAEWVEEQRQTTGYLESMKYAGKQMRISFVPLNAA